jgi:hypothetical protein
METAVHRISILFLCCILFVGAAVVVAPAPFPRLSELPRIVQSKRCLINRAAFDLINENMTRAEIERVLGGVPGDYRTRPVEWDLADQAISWSWSCILEWSQENWLGDEGTIWIRFYHDGKVRELGFLRPEHTSDP